MNLKSLIIIGTFSLSFSTVTSAAPMPKICEDYINAGNTTIELFTKIKQSKPEAAAVADQTIADMKSNLDTLKNAIEEAPDNQIDEITKACTRSIADMQEMNKTLRKAL